jgi:alkylhydroperoxidase/carboxymuconolactone decarboxylase family protein YurZ
MPISTSPEQNLQALAQGDRPVLETLTQMTIDTFDRSGLDAQTYALVRIAALVALDAAPVSYLVNLGAAKEIGVQAEDVRGLMIAIAPVVGTARVVSASSKLLRALGLAEAIAEDQ